MSIAKAGSKIGEGVAKLMKNPTTWVATTTGAAGIAGTALLTNGGDTYNIYTDKPSGPTGEGDDIATATMLAILANQNRNNGGDTQQQSSDGASVSWTAYLPWILGAGAVIALIAILLKKKGRR